VSEREREREKERTCDVSTGLQAGEVARQSINRVFRTATLCTIRRLMTDYTRHRRWPNAVCTDSELLSTWSVSVEANHGVNTTHTVTDRQNVSEWLSSVLRFLLAVGKVNGFAAGTCSANSAQRQKGTSAYYTNCTGPS